MWLIILLIALATFFYLTGIKPIRYWEERGIPTLKAWPYFGHTISVMFQTRAMALVLDDTYNAFPEQRYVGFYNLSGPMLIIRDLELSKQILVKEFETFPEHRTLIPEDADPLWSKNLFAMRGGEKWQHLRSTLSPAFTSSKMRMMFELMKECSQQFSNYYSKQGGTVTVELKDAFSRFTNDVIATTAFGITCDSLENRENEFYIMGGKVTDFSGLKGLVFALNALSPTIANILKVPVFAKPVGNFFKSIIKDTIQLREEKGIVRPDMIHLLMEARKGNLKNEEQKSENNKNEKKPKPKITDEDITAQALIFFFAGFDTASTMMSYAAYELAVNPDVQDKLRKEVDEALKKSNGDITYEVLMGMKYLDMVVAETLRKWPPFVLVDRRAVKPFRIEPEKPGEKAFVVEPGTICAFPVYSIQRNPDYFPNPDKFDPERFNEENKANINPFSYLVFGMGPRNCIGARFALLEGKLIIAEIIRKFEIVPVEKTQIPLVLSNKQFNLMPDGFWLGLKPRK
ncbi:hypothetical protein ILUMI_06631 [Ignelater luminosus]|uniref:Cytochrome P450 n=2 Tax=Ignelater luminosus TaxID=2038154 RepID=A0A8K0DAS0_IGNLU|nr:hypothetical protein ILUMI_06631 [Ignelater luminosus]